MFGHVSTNMNLKIGIAPFATRLMDRPPPKSRKRRIKRARVPVAGQDSHLNQFIHLCNGGLASKHKEDSRRSLTDRLVLVNNSDHIIKINVSIDSRLLRSSCSSRHQQGPPPSATH